MSLVHWVPDPLTASEIAEHGSYTLAVCEEVNHLYTFLVQDADGGDVASGQANQVHVAKGCAEAAIRYYVTPAACQRRRS